MIDILKGIWIDLLKPSDTSETAYQSMVIAISHAVLGAALASIPVAASMAVVFRAAVPVIYWLTKETRDMRRGGRAVDGAIDASFVALGALYAGPPWWPWSVMAAAAIVSAAFAARR